MTGQVMEHRPRRHGRPDQHKVATPPRAPPNTVKVRKRFAVQKGEIKCKINRTYSILPYKLAHGPRLLILDEPTNGLDPIALLRIIQLIREIRKEGAVGILISSHLLREVDEILDGRRSIPCWLCCCKSFVGFFATSVEKRRLWMVSALERLYLEWFIWPAPYSRQVHQMCLGRCHNHIRAAQGRVHYRRR
jgi:hypothetical protein